MPTYTPLLGQIAVVFGLSSLIPYVISILKGKTKPERATFAIWSMIGAVGFLSYIASGALSTAWLPIAFTFNNIIVFLLSLKYGVGGFNKLDITCLIGGAAGTVLWIVTKNPLTALYISSFVVVLGFIPTIKKAYVAPETEDTLAWTLAAIASTLNTLAALGTNFAIMLYPLIGFIGDTTISLFLLRGHFTRRAKSSLER